MIYSSRQRVFPCKFGVRGDAIGTPGGSNELVDLKKKILIYINNIFLTILIYR